MTNASTVVTVVSQELRWIADTGASMEFIGKNKLSTTDKAKAIKVNDPTRCNTRNGTVTINRRKARIGVETNVFKRGLCQVMLRHVLA